MTSFNSNINADDQVSAEEMIASLIFDCEAEDTNGDPIRLPEGECAQLGRDILLRVLARFCPDLVS